jgi:plastocyanin
MGVLVLALVVSGCSLGTARMNPPSTTAVPFVGSTPPGGSTTATSSETSTTSHEIIKMTSKGFSPATVTVKVGTRVVWANDMKDVHNLDFGNGVKSGLVKLGSSASHVFTEAGTYPYTDSLNPELKGVIIVK